MSASLTAFERTQVGVSNTVYKSGPLFISSKGIGWTSWKKRWFILTRTSLVFFKSDPNAHHQSGCEINLALGGIDLNNSGSVGVREDKKLLTILFPDGRDGRAFTLKAETSEDLCDWKTALEHALSQAPSTPLVMGHDAIFQSETNDTIEGSYFQRRGKHPVKSMVVGRPILLALEDIDGGSSFLEKALQFLEQFGTKVEGILRQSADVEEVDRRVQEYEQGKTEFGPYEDAHVVGDCVKHVLRELPSSPVSASCCTALLEAYKINQKEAQMYAMRAAIMETFPEPSRRLLQRILKMMNTISSHAQENRMTPAAVAACMAPLLLRPLLAGECELDDEYDVNGDNSAQLLAAANAANNAQAIITTLLEEYDNIFYDDDIRRCSMSADSQVENDGNGESSDDENVDTLENGFHVAENEVETETYDDVERVLSEKISESGGCAGSGLSDHKAFGSNDYVVESPRGNNISVASSQFLLAVQPVKDPNVNLNEQQGTHRKGNKISSHVVDASYGSLSRDSYPLMGETMSSVDLGTPVPISWLESSSEKPQGKAIGPNVSTKRSTFWGKSNNRRSPSVESVDSSREEELTIQRLEIAKNDLQNRIAKEARGNAVLQASLERRKAALHERRLALEQDVSRLLEQLQAERDLRAALEVGLSMSSGQLSSACDTDTKTRAELEEIALAEADVGRLKQKVAELHHQLSQRQNHYGSLSDSFDSHRHLQNRNSQPRFLRQEFDTSLAFVDHERKQGTEKTTHGADWKNIKAQSLASGSRSKHPSQKHFLESISLNDSKSTETSTSMSTDELGVVDSAFVPSTSKVSEAAEVQRHPSAASSALVELTTRLDFFKERRSQLMEQLHSLDLNYVDPTQDLG